jgi:soluble lytic murein transglycosylase-like protein
MSLQTLRLFDGFAHTTPQLKQVVMKLQTYLQQRGYRVKIDGEYGPYTENVVKIFQASRGLPANGIVGPETWALLAPAEATSTATRFTTTYAYQDPNLLKQLVAFKQYQSIVEYTANQMKILPSIVAGIGSRESHWGLALTPPGPTGTGDKGHGRGLMQVDDRWHIEHTSGEDWKNPLIHITYAVKLLRWSIDTFATKTGTSGNTALYYGIAAYNCGVGNAMKAYQLGQDFDYLTTGRDYARNVLSRAGWFQLYGIK